MNLQYITRNGGSAGDAGAGEGGGEEAGEQADDGYGEHGGSKVGPHQTHGVDADYHRLGVAVEADEPEVLLKHYEADAKKYAS